MLSIHRSRKDSAAHCITVILFKCRKKIRYTKKALHKVRTIVLSYMHVIFWNKILLLLTCDFMPVIGLMFWLFGSHLEFALPFILPDIQT